MSTAIIVTGMHRSGTSLLASLLREAGVFMGDRLLPGNEFNPRGHFEDEEFLDLHEEILKENGTNWACGARPASFTISDSHRSRAAALAKARTEYTVWGWKDPRTSLFLRFWADLLPSARFIFIFRSPVLVVESLRRRLDLELLYCGRGAWTMQKLGLDPLRFRMQAAIDVWLRYNRELLLFSEARPDDCGFVEMEKLDRQFPQLTSLIRTRWQLPVRTVEVDQLRDRSLIHTRASSRVERACRCRSEAVAIYEQLRRAADW